MKIYVKHKHYESVMFQNVLPLRIELNNLTESYYSSQCRNTWQWLLLKLVNNDTFRWQTNREDSQIDHMLFLICRRHTGTAPVWCASVPSADSRTPQGDVDRSECMTHCEIIKLRERVDIKQQQINKTLIDNVTISVWDRIFFEESKNHI